MADPVLTDEEKSALIDGVASGKVEVQSSSGLQYASVVPFEFGPRARIVRNSYPRMRLLNQQLADRFTRATEQLLQREIRITFADQRVSPFSDCITNDAAVTIEIEAPPLDGHGMIVLEAAAVKHLVEAFFGGSGNDAESTVAGGFTPGELSVSRLFGNILLSAIKEVWEPLEAIAPQQVAMATSLELIDGISESDPVIVTMFEIASPDFRENLHIIWPETVLEPLLPALAGRKKERDAAEDQRWEDSIRTRVTDAVVRLTTSVGNTRMTLGELIDLTPGDVIDIDDPRTATLAANRVPLITGRLGVHDGRYAVETVAWVEPDPAR